MSHMNTPAPEFFREREESLWRDDPSSRDAILTDDFREFCRFGDVYDRDHLIDAPANNAVTVEFPFDDFRVEPLTDEVVLVTYENEITNNGVTQRARRSSVWVTDGTDWRLRFQQATTLPG